MTLLLSSFFVSLIVTLMTIYISIKFNILIDETSDGKPHIFHDHVVPRAGGIGVFGGMLLLLKTIFGFKLLVTIFLAFLSGILEDYHNSLTPKQRLLLQFIAAIFATLLNNAVITYLGLGVTIPYWAGVAFSIFAIVGMMNAINIIDGFNGLASGVVISILISFYYSAYIEKAGDIQEIVLITLGATLGFFIMNFPRGKIFLGDGGAYMLGFIVAVIGIYLAGNYRGISPWYILAIFIYPVWEVAFSIIRKLSIGLSPMQPDRYHIHMLIHRNITKNNPLTALFILLLLLPFFAISSIKFYCSICNLYIIISFVASYTIFYLYLYRKDQKSVSS